MELVFLIIQLVIAAALIGIVLMQRSSSDGFGLGSGSGSNFLSGRQSANLLTRTTAVLATLFILNSLWLGILATERSSVTLADEIEAQVDNATPTVSDSESSNRSEEAIDKPAVDDDGEPQTQESAPDSPAVPLAE